MKLTTLVLFAALTVSAFADAPTTVKLRPFVLKTVDIQVQGQTVHVLYADILKQVLLSPDRNGTQADQLVKIIDTWTPLERDIKVGKTVSHLDQPSYDLITQKINTMSWSPPVEAAEVMVDFIKYVRGLQEQDFDATPKK